jgi:hypothetical protein
MVGLNQKYFDLEKLALFQVERQPTTKVGAIIVDHGYNRFWQTR